MEPGANLPALPEPPSPLGDLVVRNGRMSGARRALTAPLTLIGQAAGVSVRLNVEGVDPLHCVILPGPGGPLLSDLNSTTGTRVNGKRVSARELRHGDVLDIGPFQFAVELPPPATSEGLPVEPNIPGPDLDALRIQAAAVAAQQAELIEEESRLRQRGTGLDRQEQQLAAHLEERRGKLQQLREQVRQERTAFKEECAAGRRELEKQQGEVARAKQQADKERRRCVELRKRLKQRWKRHFQTHEAELRRRETELTAGLEKLRGGQEAVQRDRERLHQSQLRFNGDSWQAKRDLREEWQKLGLAQQQWETVINEEESERERRNRALDARAAALAEGEQALVEQQRQWEQTEANLRREAEGLESRIRHQRSQLAGRDQQLIPPPSIVTVPPPPAAAIDPRYWPSVLRDVAGSLADQRAHLAEQWQRLLDLHDRWQQDRASAQEGLEAIGLQLEQREQQFQVREQTLLAGQAELSARIEASARTRNYLEGWQARLTLRTTNWDAERAALLSEVEAREQLLAARSERLEELHQHRTERRRQELADLRARRAQCEEARRQYAVMWQECHERREALAREQREVAGRALALERYRQEVLARSPSSAKAERRLQRLEHLDKARLERAERELQAEREGLLAELARLAERAAALRQEEDELLVRQEELRGQVAEWEGQQSQAEEEEERLQSELQRRQAQHALDERQLHQLREEVERIARLMIEEGEAQSAPSQKAA